ncbi:MAG: hypothetical protein JNL99_14025 [Zoogloea sp.]|nr:hypothetical protein [Zoogloea sp.]
MLTLEDCIGLSELDEEEILAIAEHEHIPEMAAVEMGNYLCHTPEGERRIRRMIVDDIRAARARGDTRHAAVLKTALKHYVAEHHPGHARSKP